MKTYLVVVTAIFLFFSLSNGAEPINELLKIEANPAAGFNWDYYLYIPYQKTAQSDSTAILIMPNNSGTVSDDLKFHEQKALRQLNNNRDFGDQLGVVLLMPIFPRSESESMVYTHALDRDVMLIKEGQLKRLDLQLIAMVEHARKFLAEKKIKTRAKLLMFGFSAAGMFTNRFVLMHPDLVKAAVVGSPGGWPLAPIAEYENTTLRYPVGIADLENICGKKFDETKFRQVKIFFFLGDEDENDSVIYDDSYDEPERKVIMDLFGPTPVSRWGIAEKLYQQVSDNCQFQLYEGIGHSINGKMWQEIKSFLNDALE